MPPVTFDGFTYEGDFRRWPLVWQEQRQLTERPDTKDEILELAFGEGKSRKLKSWGHQGPLNAHWLVTRGGTAPHTDPAYSRYTHHLILRNDGFKLRGADEAPPGEAVPFPLKVGAMYCLDAHSPHQVVPDPRLIFMGKPVYKVQAAVDTDVVLEPDEVWDALAPLLAADLRDGALAASKTAPAPRPK